MTAGPLVPPTPDAEKAVLTDPQSAMSRIAALEQRVDLLMQLATTVHGTRWMDELKAKHGPASGE